MFVEIIREAGDNFATPDGLGLGCNCGCCKPGLGVGCNCTCTS